MKLWPHQSAGIADVQAALGRVDRVVLTSPTGGGKSVMQALLARWAVETYGNAVMLSPRKMLTEQLHDTLDRHGIAHGVRAAGYEALADADARVQLCSLQTEIARRGRLKHMLPFRPAFTMPDEGHLFTGGAAADLLGEWGGRQVLVTATPLGLAARADELVVAGETSDLRECGALVWADVYAPDEPDLVQVRKVRVCDSEKLFKGDEYRQQVFGRVLDHWRRLNPDRRPTILFAPGIAESKWFVDQFAEHGVRAAHIDGEDTYLDGETVDSCRERRDAIVAEVKAGTVNVLCNRFVFREGVDIPELYHLIFACAVGSLSSYVQAVGRVLRNHPSLDGRVVVQDHGGNWWRHGSPNEDRGDFWREFWRVEESEASAIRHDRLRDNPSAEAEPIVCEKCGRVRRTGKTCGDCGHRFDRRVRNVIQADGTLRQVHGRALKPRVTLLKPDTAELWAKAVWQARRSKNGMSLSSARGLFKKTHGYYPPPDIPLMPKPGHEAAWYGAARDLRMSDLIPGRPTPAARDPQTTLFGA